jgi:hypothetical protein
MISDTRMWYGSPVALQGRARPFRSYQRSRTRRNCCLSVGDGMASGRVGAGRRAFLGIGFNETVSIPAQGGDSGRENGRENGFRNHLQTLIIHST